MPKIQCQECDQIIGYGIFDASPECEECGSTDFGPIVDTADKNS